MDFNALADKLVYLIERLGFAAMVAAYFMFKDYRISERQAEASEKIATNLALLNDNTPKEKP